MSKVGSIFSKLTSPALRSFVFAAYLASPLFGDKKSEAALPPVRARQNIVDFTSLAGKRVRAEGLQSQDHSIDWHSLITAFYVLDEFDIKETEELRAYVLSRGASDPSIPFNALQTAMCTSATWANTINKQVKDLSLRNETLLAELNSLKENNPARSAKEVESSELTEKLNDLLTRKRKVFELVNIFTGKAVVDVEVNGKKERKLVPEGEIDKYFGSNEKNEIYDPMFLIQTDNAIAQLCSQKELDSFVPAFLAGSHNAQRTLILSSRNPLVRLPDNARQHALKIFLKERELASRNLGGESEVKLNSRSEYHDLDFQSKIFQANNVLLLALNNDSNAPKISAEWFRTKPSEKADEADFIALRALAICVRNAQEAFNELGFVAKTFPNVFDAYIYANNTLHYNLKRAAGQEILNTFNANSNAAKKLFHNLLKDSTGSSHTSAIVVLGTMGDMKGNLNILREVIADSKSSNEDKIAAMIGLARCRDESSIEQLLKIAINESNDFGIRVKALETVLIIDTKDPIPASYREKVAKQYPLGLDMSLFDDYFKQGRIRNEFVDTVLKDVRLENDAVDSLMREVRNRFAFSSGHLARLAKDLEFSKEYLDPLVSLLDSSVKGKNFDFNLGIPSMLVLANANYERAYPLVLQCAVNPELTVLSTPRDQIFIGAQRPSANQIFLRLFALEILGDVIPLEDLGNKGPEKLFSVADAKDAFYQDSGLRGLVSLATRYQAKNEHSELRQKYLSQALVFLENLRKPVNVYMSRKTDWYAENKREFDICNLVFKLGGASNLAKIALEDKKSPLTRTIVNVFIVNNFTPEKFGNMSLEGTDVEELKTAYSYHANKEHSIPEGELTGKGVTIAIVDGGLVMDKDGVIIPDELITPYKLEGQFSPHSNTVARIIHSAAPGAKTISGTWDQPIPSNPYMPDYLQDDTGYGFIKQVILGNLTGSRQTDILGQSRGHKSFRLGEEPTRGNIDIRNAILELVEAAGIISVSSAGNDTGGYPGSTSYGPIGNLNPLGFRFDNENHFYQIPGQIIVGAFDPLTGIPLPFSSTPDVLRDQEVNITGIDGVHIMDAYDGSRQVGATSFSTPLLEALIARRIELSRKKGEADPLPLEIRKAIDDSSEKVPGEIDRRFDARKFLFDTPTKSRQLAP